MNDHVVSELGRTLGTVRATILNELEKMTGERRLSEAPLLTILDQFVQTCEAERKNLYDRIDDLQDIRDETRKARREDKEHIKKALSEVVDILGFETAPQNPESLLRIIKSEAKALKARKAVEPKAVDVSEVRRNLEASLAAYGAYDDTDGDILELSKRLRAYAGDEAFNNLRTVTHNHLDVCTSLLGIDTSDILPSVEAKGYAVVDAIKELKTKTDVTGTQEVLGLVHGLMDGFLDILDVEDRGEDDSIETKGRVILKAMENLKKDAEVSEIGNNATIDRSAFINTPPTDVRFEFVSNVDEETSGLLDHCVDILEIKLEGEVSQLEKWHAVGAAIQNLKNSDTV